jgi:hypothetical protein
MKRGAYLRLAFVLILVSVQPPVASAEESNAFVDDDRNRFAPYLERAAQEGILIGCNPPQNDRACPDLVVTRGDMAIMLDRAIDLPRGSSDMFTDIGGHPAESAIAAVAAAGITNGCPTPQFCPDLPLSRGEMATLITRAVGWDTPATTGPYLDLNDSPFGPAMALLARRGGLEPCDLPVGLRLCPRMRVTRAEAAYALVSALGLPPSSSVADRTESFPIGFVDDFAALHLWDGRSPSSRNRVRLTPGGYRGTGLRVQIPKGSHFGADFKLDFSDRVGDEPELLYFRYMLRFDPDWVASVGGKLPGFSGVYGRSGKGGYRSSPSTPGWSARLQWFHNDRGDPRVTLGYYVYHLGQERKYGDSMAWGEAARLQRGEWYCVEGEVRLNTPGLSNGALRAWVDETSVFDESGLAFRRPGEPNIRINSFWFDVYYGGKPVAPRDLGLVIDEVEVDTQRIGCGAGGGTSQTVTGDFTGDGFADSLRWGSCVTSDCFRLRTTSTSGKRSTRDVGNGAWFSLDTHRVGMASGDLDGDGVDELVYPGRCAGSVPCWRVHQLKGAVTKIGRDWGAGSRFTSKTTALVAGDWDGDGLDDLVYDGLCGSDRERCWRLHRSAGDRFLEPEAWGEPKTDSISSLAGADINGDGLDDLVYQAPCGDATCWFAQTSTGSGFHEAVRLGKTRGFEREWSQLFDWNADGRADVVSIKEDEKKSQIRVRLMRDDQLGKTMVVAQRDQRVTDITLRRVDQWSPVEALVTVGCDDSATCVEYLKTVSMRLLTPVEYDEAIAEVRATLLTCPAQLGSGSQTCHLPT